MANVGYRLVQDGGKRERWSREVKSLRTVYGSTQTNRLDLDKQSAFAYPRVSKGGYVLEVRFIVDIAKWTEHKA